MTTKEYLETANKEMGRKVWEHYGEEAQTKKLVEELAELITAIAREDARAVREEMADVEVMIMQFKQGLNDVLVLKSPGLFLLSSSVLYIQATADSVTSFSLFSLFNDGKNRKRKE